MRSEILLYLAVYVLIAAAVGKLNHRRRESAQHFLHTDRNLSFWIVSLSFLAANCSALEVLTMIAVAAKYGMIAVHFYWIGAVPALAFLLLVLLPRYQRLGVRSVPEYLGRRFGHSTRLLSAGSFCMLMVAISGITLCVTSRLIHLTLGWSYWSGIWLMTSSATAFLIGGGLSGVIYSEALQLLIFLVVLVPMTIMTLREAGGIASLIAKLPVAQQHTFQALPLASPHATADLFGTIVGLGFVLSFSYWCVDFLLIQRLGAAKNPKEMLRTPSVAIAAKLALPLILVVPGLGSALYGHAVTGSFDLSLPRLLLDHYPSAVAALAMAAMIASLFLGMCGNISAGVAIFTSDIYKPSVQSERPDRHFLNTGRVATVVMALLSAGAAYLAFGSSSLMEYIQFVLSSLNVPIATVLMLGIFFPGMSRRSGSIGLLAGTAAGLLNLYFARSIHYGSGLNEGFYGALLAAFCTTCSMLVVSYIFPLTRTLQFNPVKIANLSQNPLAATRGTKILTFFALTSMLALYVAFK